MGKKLDALFGKSFKPTKCKDLMKIVVSRIKILKNKHEIQRAQCKQDIALLLQKDQVTSARSRVDLLFKEQNIIKAFELIEGFCHLVMERMVAIEKQKGCPTDLKEAIASLVFAAPRIGELPELQDVRSIFTSKYGPEFTSAAVELHSDCGVSSQIIDYLSTKTPTADVKLRIMKEIAAENSVEFDFDKAEKEMLKAVEGIKKTPKLSVGEKQQSPKPLNEMQGNPLMNDIKATDEMQKNSKGTKKSDSVSQSPPAAQLPLEPSNQRKALDVKEMKGQTKANAVSTGVSKYTVSDGDVYGKLRREGKMDYPISSGKASIEENEQELPSSNRETAKSKSKVQYQNPKYAEYEDDLDKALEAATRSSATKRVSSKTRQEAPGKDFQAKNHNRHVSYPDSVIPDNQQRNCPSGKSRSASYDDCLDFQISSSKLHGLASHADDFDDPETANELEEIPPLIRRKNRHKKSYNEKSDPAFDDDMDEDPSIPIKSLGRKSKMNRSHQGDDEYIEHNISNYREGYVDGKQLAEDPDELVPLQKHKGRRNRGDYQAGVGTSKPSFENFLRQQTHAFDRFDPQVDDGANSLNDYERRKFSYNNKPPTGRRKQPGMRSGPSSDRLSEYSVRTGMRNVPSTDRLSEYDAFSARSSMRSIPSSDRISNLSEYSEQDHDEDLDLYSVTGYEDTGNRKKTYANVEDMSASRKQNRKNPENATFGNRKKSYSEVEQALQEAASLGSDGEKGRASIDSIESVPDVAEKAAYYAETYKQSRRHHRGSTHSYEGSRSSSRTPPHGSRDFMQSKINYDSLFDPRDFVDSPPRHRRNAKPKPEAPVTDEELYARFEALKMKK